MIELPTIRALPRSGQTTSYRTGDAGDLKQGWPDVSRRFEIIGGTGNLVIDHHTGLMWVREVPKIRPGGSGLESLTARGAWSAGTDYAVNDLVVGDGSPDSLYYIAIAPSGPGNGGAQEPPNAAYWVQTVWTASAANLTTPASMNWNDGVDRCLALAYGGFDDWRMPNRVELMTLLDGEQTSSPTVYRTPFPAWPTDLSTWSSNTYGLNTAFALRMFASGSFTGDNKTSSVQYVRPVRPIMGW